MGTPAVGVDRPAERHSRLLRNAIQRRACLHLMKMDADRLRSIEGPNHRVTQAAQLALRAGSSLQVVPSHDERMFADVEDGQALAPGRLRRADRLRTIGLKIKEAVTDLHGQEQIHPRAEAEVSGGCVANPAIADAKRSRWRV